MFMNSLCLYNIHAHARTRARTRLASNALHVNPATMSAQVTCGCSRNYMNKITDMLDWVWVQFAPKCWREKTDILYKKYIFYFVRVKTSCLVCLKQKKLVFSNIQTSFLRHLNCVRETIETGVVCTALTADAICRRTLYTTATKILYLQ